MNTSLGLLQVTHKQTHMFLFSVSEQQRTTARNMCPKTLEFIGIFAMVYKNFPCYRVLFITQCPVRKRRVYRGIEQHPRTVATTTTSHNNKLVVLLLLISIQLTSDSMWFALNILSYVCVCVRSRLSVSFDAFDIIETKTAAKIRARKRNICASKLVRVSASDYFQEI